MKLQDWLLFLFFAGISGISWSVTKNGMSFVGPATFLLHRFMIAAISMLPIILFLRKSIPNRSETLRKLVVFALINVSSLLVANIGLVGENSGIAAMLFYTQPLFVFCLATVLLREKITLTKLTGTLMGFGGVILLLSSRLGSATFNSALTMVLGALLWASSIVYYKKYLTNVNPFIANSFQLVVGIVPLTILTMVTNSFIVPSDTSYLWLILVASFVTLGGGISWLLLLRRGEAIVLSSSSYVVPVIALFLGWLLLREELQMLFIPGAAFILAGLCIVNIHSAATENARVRILKYVRKITVRA